MIYNCWQTLTEKTNINMKKKYIYLTIIILSIFSIDLNAQSTLFANINGPNGMAIKDNYLYVIAGGKIFKADITIENPPLIEVVNGIIGGAKIAFNGNELYIADFYGYKISKIDITQSNPNLVDVITGIYYPDGIVFKGNDLYFTYLTNAGYNISKIDVSQSNPTLIDVITDTEVLFDLAIIEDELFASTGSVHKVFKIDLNQSNPLPVDVYTSGNYIHGLAVSGNDLYLADVGEYKISKINTTQSVPTPLDIATNLDQPFYLTTNTTDIYFSSFHDDTISKIDLTSLNVNEFENLGSITIYPNPTEDIFYITGFKGIVSYDVYNTRGQKLLTGKTYQNEKIDITELTSGFYFIKIDKNVTRKIVKK
jgi:hypothetical protein